MSPRHWFAALILVSAANTAIAGVHLLGVLW